MMRRQSLYCGPQGYSPRWLTSRGKDPSVLPPLDRARVFLTHNGRTAIDQAITVLGLKRGDEILVPAFNCGSEVAPFLVRGIHPRLYRVNRSAEIDVDDLRSRITGKTRALYVTHYFGFPQDLSAIRTICRDRGLRLIEDCALSLFSRRGEMPLGLEGEVSIFSLWKMMPILCGGALLINHPGIPDPPAMHRPSLYLLSERMAKLTAFTILSSLEDILPVSSLVSYYLSFRLRKSGDSRRQLWNQRKYYSPGFNRTAMHQFARQMIPFISSGEIFRARRANFELLLDLVPETVQVRPFYKILPEGVCPLYFPVICQDRREIHRRLTRAGIVAIRWWSIYLEGLPWDEYPEACYLKDHLLALPIHPGLGRRHMEYMAGCLNSSR